jgi:hypothetical protein
MMNKLLLAVVSSVLFAGCLDSSEGDAKGGVATDSIVEVSADFGPQLERLATRSREVDPDRDTRPLCEQVVATEGPCAVACDPAAVMSFVKKGTCSFITCTVEDGTTFNTGGCNP